MDNQTEIKNTTSTTPSAPGSAGNSSNTMPVATSDRKKTNVAAIVLGCLALVFGGLAVYFGIEYFKPKTSGSEGQSSDSNGGADAGTNVSSDMAEEYNEVVGVMNNLKAGIENTRNGYIENGRNLAYKPDELNTYIPMKLNLQTVISNSDSNVTNVDILKNKLKEAGFESLGILPFIGSAGPEIFGYLNSDNIICGVYGDKEWQGLYGDQDYTVLECAKTGWVWLTNEELALVGKLEQAYYDKVGKYPMMLNDLGTKIMDSQVSPYQTLQYGVGGAIGLFYRTNPEAEWQFFTAATGAQDCDEFNTEDLKKAYAGRVCYNGPEQSTVQP